MTKQTNIPTVMSTYKYIHTYIYTYIHTYIYIYTYRERERESPLCSLSPKLPVSIDGIKQLQHVYKEMRQSTSHHQF